MIRLLVIVLSFISVTAEAHPGDEWAAQSRALAQWAESLTELDAAATAALTASGMEPRQSAPNSIVITRHATFSTAEDGTVEADPVVVSTDRGTFLSAWRVVLIEEESQWKIAGSSPGSTLPSQYVDMPLPEHRSTQPVTFQLTDADTGLPVYARVRITDAAGDYWPPNGHQRNIRTGWRENVGGDVQIDGKNYAYVGPEFVAELPPGDFDIEVRKGTEYLPTEASFDVLADGTDVVEVEVQRWIDMRSQGWLAGDTHTHFLDDQTGLLELRAEDLDVLYILATKWGELITDVTRFTGTPSPHGVNGEAVVVNEETRHGTLGHTILHGINQLIYPLTWGGPSEGVPGGFDYPAMAHQAEKAHAQGGLVTWAHFPFPGLELPVDVALGKVDTVDLFTWGDPFAANGEFPSAADTWYAFLNTNARLPATAGTDKMLNVQVTGSVKTYAHTGEERSYEAWLNALRAGRTTVSSGPVVTITANGEPIGSELALEPGAPVEIEAEMLAPYEQYPVDTLEIVVGGEVVSATANNTRQSRLRARATVNPETSTWIAARAHGGNLLPYQKWALLNAQGIPPVAHTSPIYLIVDGRPIWEASAAQFLATGVERAITWVEEQGKYQNDAQKTEILALFEKAKAYYQAPPTSQ